jgi:hypothetical protein
MKKVSGGKGLDAGYRGCKATGLATGLDTHNARHRPYLVMMPLVASGGSCAKTRRWLGQPHKAHACYDTCEARVEWRQGVRASEYQIQGQHAKA